MKGPVDFLGRCRLISISACIALMCATASAQDAQSGAAKAPTKAAPAPAPLTSAPQEKTAAWSVDCSNAGAGLACKATQTIIIAKTHQLLLGVSVSKNRAESTAAMLLHLPLGLFNPSGVTVAVDATRPEKLDIQTCDARGCYAGMPLPPEKITAMSSGAKLNVVFQDLKKRNIPVPVPLTGFADAYKKVVTP